MQPHDAVYLRHMLDFCCDVEAIVAGADDSAWDADVTLRLAHAVLARYRGHVRFHHRPPPHTVAIVGSDARP